MSWSEELKSVSGVLVSSSKFGAKTFDLPLDEGRPDCAMYLNGEALVGVKIRGCNVERQPVEVSSELLDTSQSQDGIRK